MGLWLKSLEIKHFSATGSLSTPFHKMVDFAAKTSFGGPRGVFLLNYVLTPKGKTMAGASDLLVSSGVKSSYVFHNICQVQQLYEFGGDIIQNHLSTNGHSAKSATTSR
jgi:hypothetical protein